MPSIDMQSTFITLINFFTIVDYIKMRDKHPIDKVQIAQHTLTSSMRALKLIGVFGALYISHKATEPQNSTSHFCSYETDKGEFLIKTLSFLTRIFNPTFLLEATEMNDPVNNIAPLEDTFSAIFDQVNQGVKNQYMKEDKNCEDFLVLREMTNLLQQIFTSEKLSTLILQEEKTTNVLECLYSKFEGSILNRIEDILSTANSTDSNIIISLPNSIDSDIINHCTEVIDSIWL